jgi:serine/threonine-protein kinase
MADTPASRPVTDDAPTEALRRDDHFADEDAVAESERRLGEFRLLRRLGAGGMAEVWLAEQTSLKRHVALKLLKRELTSDPTYVRRFETEAKAAAGLNHPNLVQVYTVGQHDGQHYIAQEYVQGQTLRNLLTRKGPLAASVALHIMRQVSAALIAAAERGIVHRDIKPENIMLTRKGEVKVADFGLAQVSQGEQLHLTQEGVTMGTPLYMSPEQVKGRKLDQRSDIYSFGVTCYHMLAGRPPFHGETAVTVAVQHLQDEAEPLKAMRPDLPPALCDVVHRMMAKDPEQRYQDAQSLHNDVRRLLKALKDPGGGQNVELADFAAPVQVEKARASRKTILLRVLLCLLIAGVAAGIGWLQRTPSLLAVEHNTRTGVNKADSAKNQYIQALFSGGAEEEWLAVRNEWPGPDDQLWRIRATEQLALLYLHDPSRVDDAKQTLKDLESFSAVDPRYGLEAKLGEAALAAYTPGGYGTVKAILTANSTQFDEQLRGGWRDLHEDLKRQLEDSQRLPGANAPPLNRPPPGQPPNAPPPDERPQPG